MHGTKQELEFAVACFKEMQTRDITPEQMQMELESDLMVQTKPNGLPSDSIEGIFSAK